VNSNGGGYMPVALHHRQHRFYQNKDDDSVVGKVCILFLKGMKLKGGDERDTMENIKTKTYSCGLRFWKEIKKPLISE